MDLTKKFNDEILYLNFIRRLDLFKSLLEERQKTNGYFKTAVFSFTYGNKFIKILRESSVYGFIDYEGNIYKAASYYKPALHARGSIYNDNPLEGTNEYGVNYSK